MAFSTPAFIFVFLPLALCMHWLMPRFLRKASLLALSLFFYMWGESQAAIAVMLLAVLNYLFALVIEWLQRVDAQAGCRHARLAMFVAVAVNVGVLFYYKYAAYVLGLLGFQSSSWNGHQLPLGISFFTFQAIAYLVDTYRQQTRADHNPLNVGLCLLYYAKVGQGPLVRYQAFASQPVGQSGAFALFAMGVRRFAVGLAKKILVADILGVTANAIFAVHHDQMTAGMSWLGLLCYTLQIFYDFSGYTDMAIGLGNMCGYELPENFNYPYVANSIKNFWDRWHMTLSRWLRDYLFLPIAVSVSKRLRGTTYAGIKTESIIYWFAAIVTMSICGLWHGAGTRFVLWGAWHGVFLCVERSVVGRMLLRAWWPVRHAYAVAVVAIGWVFFRAESLSQAMLYLQSMWGSARGDGKAYYAAMYLDRQLFCTLVVAVVFSMPVVPQLGKTWRALLRHTPAAVAAILDGAAGIVVTLSIVALFVVAIATMANSTYNPFIYFRF